MKCVTDFKRTHVICRIRVQKNPETRNACFSPEDTGKSNAQIFLYRVPTINTKKKNWADQSPTLSNFLIYKSSVYDTTNTIVILCQVIYYSQKAIANLRKQNCFSKKLLIKQIKVRSTSKCFGMFEYHYERRSKSERT